MKKVLIFIIVLIILVNSYWFYSEIEKEKELFKESKFIIQKIDQFSRVNGRIPSTLVEIGLVESDSFGAIFYQPEEDSMNYIVVFYVEPEKPFIYYSDSRKWETQFRRIPLKSQKKL